MFEHTLLKIIKFSTQSKIFVSQCLTCSFNCFASLRYLFINAHILFIEFIKVSNEFLSHFRCLTKNFACKSFNLLHFSWSSCLLFNTEIISKFILILFSQEVNKEFTSSKNLWFHHRYKELLVVNFLFAKLTFCEFFLLVHYWQRWNNYLWIFLYQIMPELNEIDI